MDDFRVRVVVKGVGLVVTWLKADIVTLLMEGVVADVGLRTGSKRTDQRYKVTVEKRDRVRWGRRDGAIERSSSTQFLLFCVTETILSPG